MKRAKKCLSLFLVLAMVLSLSVSALAADSTSYIYTAPTEPMAIDDNIITASAHRGAAPLLGMFGVNAVAGYSMINGGVPADLEAAEQCAALGIWGTDINDNPDPYYWNYFYNFYAEENGLPISDDALINNSTVSGPASADTFLYEEYGNVSVSLYRRPDILVGVSGNDGPYSGYDSQLETIASFYEYDENGNVVPTSEFYQEGDENYNPTLVSFNADLIKQVIATVNEFSEAIVKVEEETGKTTRYGDVTEIAEDYEAYVYGLVAYVLKELDEKGLDQKTVAVINSVNEDGTYTLYESVDQLIAEGKSADDMTNKAYEYTMCVSESLGDKVGSYVVTLDQLLTADAIVIDTDRASYDELMESGFGDEQYDGIMVANIPDTLYGIYHGSLESAMGYGYIIGCLYSDVIDNIQPVDLCAYFYQRFMHISDLDALNTVIMNNFSDVIFPEGISVNTTAEYSMDNVKAMLDEGVEYLTANPEKFADDAEFYLIGMDDYAQEKAEEQAELCAVDVFDDITDTEAWYYDAVDYVYHAGIMTGTTATTFSPSMTFSRAQMVTVLYRLADSPDVSGVENPFTDVSEDDWYYDEVMWAYSTGVTEGTSDTTFEPDTDVSREQTITFLYRYTTMIEERDISGEPISDLSGYVDVNDVSSWALDAVQWSVGNGIVQGTSATTLAPGNNADRATAAQMLYNYLDGYLG